MAELYKFLSSYNVPGSTYKWQRYSNLTSSHGHSVTLDDKEFSDKHIEHHEV
jgi:hypothetical protein